MATATNFGEGPSLPWSLQWRHSTMRAVVRAQAGARWRKEMAAEQANPFIEARLGCL